MMEFVTLNNMISNIQFDIAALVAQKFSLQYCYCRSKYYLYSVFLHW